MGPVLPQAQSQHWSHGQFCQGQFLRGKKDGPCSTEPGQGQCAEQAHVGQPESATKPCKRGGKQKHPSAPPPLADLVLGMLQFASVYIPWSAE